MIAYTLLEDYLAKRLKELSFLKIMRISRRLTSIVFLYVSTRGVYSIVHILILLLTSKTPDRSDIIDLLLYGFVLILTLHYRKATWYYLTKDKQTVFTDWYMRKYRSLPTDEENVGQKYDYLQKASELKPNVFIWSMMALFNQCFLEKPDLADEYLVKAQQALNNSKQPSQKDKATVESVRGEILLRRDNINEGLARLKKACDLDPSEFNKDYYENALKRATENDEPEKPVDPL
jgi:hypothetical protein